MALAVREMSTRMKRSLGKQQNLRRITLLVALAAIASLYLFGADALAQSSKQLMKPTGLEAAVVTAGIQLDWTTPRANIDEISGYKIERRRPGHGENKLIALVDDTGSTDTTYVDSTAAVEGTEFIYRVRAVRGSAISARSNKLVVTWNAADAVDTSDGNTVEFVDGDDDQQESLRHTTRPTGGAHGDQTHQEASDPCGGNPSLCTPWVQYSETSVNYDRSDWWGGGAAWSLRIRPPSVVPTTFYHGNELYRVVHEYEVEYIQYTRATRTWDDWSAASTATVPYGSGNWVSVSLDDPSLCGTYVQHRVRMNWEAFWHTSTSTDSGARRPLDGLRLHGHALCPPVVCRLAVS